MLVIVEPCSSSDALSGINNVFRIAGDRVQPVHDASWAFHALTPHFADAHLRNLHRLREPRYRLSVLAHESGYLFACQCVHLASLVAVEPMHLLTYCEVLERVCVSDGLSVEFMLDIAAIEFRHDEKGVREPFAT